MRNFLLANGVVSEFDANSKDFNQLTEGQVGFFYIDETKKQPSLAATGKEGAGEFNLVLGRKPENGGAVVLPVYRNHFTYTKGAYQEAKKFKAEFTVPQPYLIGEYGIIIAKKGLLFNERNKWTATTHVKDVNITPKQLAEKLVERINYNTETLGVTAKVDGDDGKIVIEAVKEGTDYVVLGCDLLTDVKAKITQAGLPAYGDAAYVTDLANKAAADAGFEYTYRDPYTYLYPNYPLNPLKQNDKEDKGFTIYTMRFAEPRKVKTRDEVVHQIIQVAVPADTDMATFEKVLKGLAGEASE